MPHKKGIPGIELQFEVTFSEKKSSALVFQDELNSGNYQKWKYVFKIEKMSAK